MTREEEIKNAKKTFYERIYEEGYYYDPRDCFEEGAEWADEHPNLESIWHDASEEPLLENKEIIFLNEQDNAYISESFGGTLEDSCWKRYVNLLKISRWAYIDDLLPKQFGNSEQLKGGEK